MITFVIPQQAQVISVNGKAEHILEQDSQSLESGYEIAAGGKIEVTSGAQVVLKYADGSQVIIDEHFKANDDADTPDVAMDVLDEITEFSDNPVQDQPQVSDDVLAEIRAIQDLILSDEEFIDPVSTAAGSASDGGRSSAVSVARTGDETLAESEFETETFSQAAQAQTFVDTSVVDTAASDDNTVPVDSTAPLALNVALVNDSNVVGDLVTNDGRLVVTGTEADATVEYSVDGETWTDEFVAVEGDNTVYVRQTDTEGNISSNTKLEFKLDTQIDTPTISLITDSGVDGDLITNDGSLELGNIEDGSIVEYNVNGTGWTTEYTPVEGDNSVVVRQTDAAGNSTESVPVTFALDTSIVKPTADINAGSDTAINDDNITADNTPTIDGTGEAGASVVITNAKTRRSAQPLSMQMATIQLLLLNWPMARKC